MAIRRVFYAAGPGNAIKSYQHWKQGEPNPTEISITFSSQVFDFCREIGAEVYLVGCPKDSAILHDVPFTLEHRPKPLPGARGVGYHLVQIGYGLGLLATALRFRADVAIVDSGSTHFFVLTLFRLLGIRVVPVLHNALWPSGFYPTKPIARLVMWLDKWLFWRWVPVATLCVSPECERQVDLLTKGRHGPLHLVLAQYCPENFTVISPPPAFSSRPFRIIFIGRFTRGKGVFDILDTAKTIERRFPGRVVWELRGTGIDFEEAIRKRNEMNLCDIVLMPGWLSPDEIQEAYGRNHAAIVPSRSDAGEAMAMTAIESILAGRPLITNQVVPAAEVLRPACVICVADDVDSYANGVIRLMSDEAFYNQCHDACVNLSPPFYDRERGLKAALARTLAE